MDVKLINFKKFVLLLNLMQLILIVSFKLNNYSFKINSNTKKLHIVIYALKLYFENVSKKKS